MLRYYINLCCFWVDITRGFFYLGGCEYGTKCIPTCGCGCEWWVRF
jgi:hypothetical protein